MDEIDLFDLFSGLWARKWLIAGITGVAVLLAVVYALLATPAYQASVQVRPVDRFDLARINETGMFEISPEQAFQSGLNELESQHAKMLTFNRLDAHITKLSRPDDWRWQEFAEEVSISLPVVKKGVLTTKDYATVSYVDEDAPFSALALNTLVELANDRAAATLVQELQYLLQTRISLLEQKIQQGVDMEGQENTDTITKLEETDQVEKLKTQDQISALRAKNLQLRKDKIDALEEALSIANSLDIDEPVTLAQLGNSDQGGQTSLAIQANFNGEREPLYLRGSKMLMAEITALKARKSDDFTSPAIRNLEEKLAQLENNRQVDALKTRKDNSAFVKGIGDMRAEITLLASYMEQDYSNARVLKLEQVAEPPEEPIKPKKKLIVLLAGLGGGFLGVLAALISYAAATRKVALSP